MKGDTSVKQFNVAVTLSTTVCVDADTREDAINKVAQALNADDASTIEQLSENLPGAVHDDCYEIRDAIGEDE